MTCLAILARSVALLLLWVLTIPARGAEESRAVVCPAPGVSRTPPEFTAPDCRRMPLARIDPQGKQIWVKSSLDAPAVRPGEAPLALLVSGKFSGSFHVNGSFVGSNGRPGPTADAETPGVIDVVLHLPPESVRAGSNDLVFLASAHRGLLNLDRPLQWIAIQPAHSTTDWFLRRYIPAFATLGIALLGLLYFGVSAALSIDRIRSTWLSIACAFVALQIVAETCRGLVAYAYPLHDLRLVLIVAGAAGFALGVAGYTFTSLALSRPMVKLAVLGALTLAATMAMPGFDGKTLAALGIPLLGSLVCAVAAARRGNRDGWVLGAGLVVFMALLVVFTSIFIDVVFYLLVSAFLLFLFAQQGFSLAREQAERREAAARADRLQLALDQAQDARTDFQLSISSAGKLEKIGTSHLVACRSDGGYTELLLDDGRTILHSASLADLENTLPGSFLRVHRSYLINTRLVRSLARDPAGTGTLTMNDGREIPVSRRTMPSVRLALQ